MSGHGKKKVKINLRFFELFIFEHKHYAMRAVSSGLWERITTRGGGQLFYSSTECMTHVEVRGQNSLNAGSPPTNEPIRYLILSTLYNV